MNLAERIRTERKRNHMTQEELAEKIGISQKSVSKYERGISAPGYESIARMAELFDVTVGFLLGCEEEKKGKKTPPPPTKLRGSGGDTS